MCCNDRKTDAQRAKELGMTLAQFQSLVGYDPLDAYPEYVCADSDTEELTEENFVVPEDEDYEDFGEETEEVAVASLWENIRKKKERMGKDYRPAKPGDKDRPTPDAIKQAQSGKDMSYCNCGKSNQVGGFTCRQHCKNKTEALQYGRPGKDDPRKTPAPKEDQKRGSDKNKPGSADSPNNSIEFSAQTIERLKEIVSKHNEDNQDAKATLGMLKAVYRRGAGAFSTSHHPSMSRDGWAMARVRAFLYLLRNGRPSNPNYVQDNDLLPSSHPRSSKSKAAEYQGRSVQLNKPFRTPGGPKKFSVYVRNDRGNIVKVNFGDPNMRIKKNIPERRRNFRARHNCDNPGPKWKARYWACRSW